MLSISSLVPFGSELDIHPNKADTLAGRTNKYVEFVDGDGTLHHFDYVASDVYAEPPGVHLYLRKVGSGAGDKVWAITRPDRVTFWFHDDGNGKAVYPTSVEDRNSNQLSFTVEQVADDLGWPKYRITRVTDPGGRYFQINYYTKTEWKKAHVRGKISSIVDHMGHELDVQYYLDGNLLRPYVAAITSEGSTVETLLNADLASGSSEGVRAQERTRHPHEGGEGWRERAAIALISWARDAPRRPDLPELMGILQKHWTPIDLGVDRLFQVFGLSWPLDPGSSGDQFEGAWKDPWDEGIEVIGGMPVDLAEERFVIGEGAEFWGIWDRHYPGPPVKRFPHSEDGKLLARFEWVALVRASREERSRG